VPSISDARAGAFRYRLLILVPQPSVGNAFGAAVLLNTDHGIGVRLKWRIPVPLEADRLEAAGRLMPAPPAPCKRLLTIKDFGGIRIFAIAGEPNHPALFKPAHSFNNL
jgi:hypothetical protein